MPPCELRRELRLERVVLEDGDLDGDVRVRGHEVVGHACQSDLPGSLLLMCHQSIVTGSPPAAADAGASDAAPADGAAADGAAGGSRAASTAARCKDDRCGRQKDRNAMAGSHWPSLLVVPGRVTARERARWGMTSPPMRSSARPVVAGHVPRARSRPAREEESGGDGIGGQPLRSCRSSDAPRSVAVSSSKVAERPFDTFGAANVGVSCGSVNAVSRRAGAWSRQ